MKDPIPKNYGQKSGNFVPYSNGNHNGSSYKSSGGGSGGSGKKKSDYCWNFNKGVPCKFGNKCKFIDKCKYCDSPAHGVNACPKLQKKSDGQSGQNKNQLETSK